MTNLRMLPTSINLSTEVRGEIIRVLNHQLADAFVQWVSDRL